jgi:DNA gyrase subunit A
VGKRRDDGEERGQLSLLDQVAVGAEEPAPDIPAVRMGHPEAVALHETTRERYLNYALSVITSRALPDIRDGLKPVHRRILYAMFHNLHLTADARFRKSAAVVGEVMAKYHPHGDQAIYDAMVRMAQSFSLRYPLVDGHGNFGSLDGDRAAAMRYTEAKLRHIAVELLEELKKDTVDTRATYDGTTLEPVVLPAQIPHLLINGSTGIAVGMATNMPPHNLGEVVDALVELIDDREMTLEQLMEYIPAPDFPTGGRIESSHEDLRRMYETGGGPVVLAGEYQVESGGGHKLAVITSIPYGLKKSDLVSKIADLIVAKKVPQILDVRDESTDDVRVVLELKRGTTPEVAMAFIYKHTPLRMNFHVNMTCLVPTDNPQVAGPAKVDLRTMLLYFLDFRMEIVTRRLQFDLRKLEERIHLLEGFARVFDALDEAIRIIRRSDDKADARVKLMKRFKLDEIQAEAVLEIKLYKLARMEIEAILDELEDKQREADRIRMILASEAMRNELIRAELDQVRGAYADARRTVLDAPPQASAESFDPEAYIVKEDAWVIVTRDGWIKRQRGFSDVGAIRVREEDEVRWLIRGSTRECVCLFTDRGVCYVLRIDDVPATTGHGEPVQRFFAFDDGEQVIGAIVSDPRVLPPAPEGADEFGWPLVLAVTRAGKCLRFPLEPHRTPSNKAGRRYVRLEPGMADDRVLMVGVTVGHENVCVASEKARCSIFSVDDVNVLSGVGKGVLAMKLEKGDLLLGAVISEAARKGLVVESSRGATMVVRTTKYEVTSRGGRGRQMLKRAYLRRAIPDPVVPLGWGEAANGNGNGNGNGAGEMDEDEQQ